MAKSIRAKCKRKARAEFRRTIGEKAYQKQQTQIQEKLKDCVEKQSMQSLERLSNLFQPNSDDNELQVIETSLAVDAMETTTVETTTVSMKGENKAPLKKSKRRKHSLKNSKKSAEMQKESTEKRRPKYFVQF